jgi:hypothetical protein
MDGDQAGNSAASFITGLSRAAHCIYVPQGKDINEFYLLAGYEAVKNWIVALIGNYS